MNQGDLFIEETFMQRRRAVRTGVRASIVAVKSLNGDGEKGGRKVEK